MVKTAMIKKICELKPKAGELGKFLIDEICELIDCLPEKNLKKVEKLFDLIDNYLDRDSKIDNVDSYLASIHTELKKQLFEAQKQIKDEALSSMRKKKKKRLMSVIVMLGIITGVVLTLGILSALGFISDVWCNVIGVIDCAFGLIFFIYEYCDDKSNEASIEAGDSATIKKYFKGTGDISNSGDGSVNVTGKVKGNITISADIDKLFN